MKIHPRSELETTASNFFTILREEFQPCEMIYILSELAKIIALAMLQREQEEDDAP